MIEALGLTCPYCGEYFTMLVDCSAGDQDYVEDCVVCCRPIKCHLALTTNGPTLRVHRDDD